MVHRGHDPLRRSSHCHKNAVLSCLSWMIPIACQADAGRRHRKTQGKSSAGPQARTKGGRPRSVLRPHTRSDRPTQRGPLGGDRLNSPSLDPRSLPWAPSGCRSALLGVEGEGRKGARGTHFEGRWGASAPMEHPKRPRPTTPGVLHRATPYRNSSRTPEPPQAPSRKIAARRFQPNCRPPQDAAR